MERNLRKEIPKERHVREIELFMHALHALMYVD